MCHGAFRGHPRGVSLWILSSGESEFFCRFVLVRRVGAEHGVQDIDPAAGEADESGVVFLTFGALRS